MATCPHCQAPYEPNRRGAVKGMCARCYQWSRAHPDQPIPPRGARPVPVVAPRISFACPVLLLEMMAEMGVGEGERSGYIRRAVEEQLTRDTAARARAAGFSRGGDRT